MSKLEHAPTPEEVAAFNQRVKERSKKTAQIVHETILRAEKAIARSEGTPQATDESESSQQS